MAPEKKKWYSNPTITMVLGLMIFGIIALAYMGIIDLPKLNSNDTEIQPVGCPTEPDPPCWSKQGEGDLDPVVRGVYVYDYCECPDGTEYYTTVGTMIYCDCIE